MPRPPQALTPSVGGGHPWGWPQRDHRAPGEVCETIFLDQKVVGFVFFFGDVLTKCCQKKLRL